ncbi:MAG: sulfatase-like hydrolase/transferase [Prolixibacteraceae bacterium]|nr:sulfatase-like hydrolase/transferase [Prolixibacteraceae bacterium]
MILFYKQFIRLLKYFIFWMIFFLLSKAFFLLSNLQLSRELSLSEISGIFIYGLKMDISTACYLLVLPGLLFSLRGRLFPPKFLNQFLWIYTLIILVIASFLIVLDQGLYPHWGTRVNVTAFNYIDDPVAMSASVSLFDVLKGLLIMAVFVVTFMFLYRRINLSTSETEDRLNWKFSLLHLFVLAFLIIPIRGGLDTSPINLSSVAFSTKLYVNQAATNYLWNFAKSVQKRKRFQNPCIYMSKERSEEIFAEFMKPDSANLRPNLITLNEGRQPNVILVILESFSNKVIASLGGMHGISSNLDSLCVKSTVFNNFYSTGNRSDRGISSLLGGYPSLLSTSIMISPEKSSSLTLLPEYFNRRDYNTSFYYGGDINFYNLKTFVLQGKYKQIVTKSDFPAEVGRMTKWGVPDSYLFEKAIQDLNSEREPFMKTIYTVSSHPPFDVPFSKIKGDTKELKYLNSIAYTDSCLGVFVREFRKSRLWENTLLIITSDHGYLLPGPTEVTDPASYRIPLIWTGGLVDSLKRVDTICMQSDFPIFLINQLGWKFDSIKFSRDFFSGNPFAFYMLDTGWGYLTSEGKLYYDQNAGNYTSKPAGSAINMDFPKAYMQVLHDDFISR